RRSRGIPRPSRPGRPAARRPAAGPRTARRRARDGLAPSTIRPRDQGRASRPAPQRAARPPPLNPATGSHADGGPDASVATGDGRVSVSRPEPAHLRAGHSTDVRPYRRALRLVRPRRVPRKRLSLAPARARTARPLPDDGSDPARARYRLRHGGSRPPGRPTLS